MVDCSTDRLKLDLATKIIAVHPSTAIYPDKVSLSTAVSCCNCGQPPITKSWDELLRNGKLHWVCLVLIRSRTCRGCHYHVHCAALGCDDLEVGVLSHLWVSKNCLPVSTIWTAVLLVFTPFHQTSWQGDWLEGGGDIKNCQMQRNNCARRRKSTPDNKWVIDDTQWHTQILTKLGNLAGIGWCIKTKPRCPSRQLSRPQLRWVSFWYHQWHLQLCWPRLRNVHHDIYIYISYMASIMIAW